MKINEIKYNNVYIFMVSICVLNYVNYLSV